jgi:cytochrome c-type biogenesis protein
MLICYSLGLGVPFVISGFAFAHVSELFGWFKRHLRVVNLVSGLILAGLGVLMLTDTLHYLSSWFIHLPGLSHLSL